MPEFVRYASCCIAMLMGFYLRNDMKISAEQLTHKNFKEAEEIVREKSVSYYMLSIAEIRLALGRIYTNPDSISLQQMSAIFRSPKLVDELLQARKLASMPEKPDQVKK